MDDHLLLESIGTRMNMLTTAGGSPTTYTRLYIYPDQRVVTKSKNVAELFEAYGGFMPIPVSPKSLQYTREADHTEAYSIMGGGLLQRNLPGLWHLTIESYAPKDLMERAFHNRSQDKQWPGVYTQQTFVDYMNALMRYKVPFLLYDSSNPERIKHSGEIWCIKSFEYTMQPHDDIDYKLELVEWREPTVKLSNVEMREIGTKPEEPKKTRGGSTGKALMVFGYTDVRTVNSGSVYPPDMRAILKGNKGAYFPVTNPSALRGAALYALKTQGNHTSIKPYGRYVVRFEQSKQMKDSRLIVPISLDIPKALSKQRKNAVADAISYIKRTLLHVILTDANAKTYINDKEVRVLYSGAAGGLISNASDNPQYKADASSKPEAWKYRYGGSRLDRNAWCRKLAEVTNIRGMSIRIENEDDPTEALTVTVIVDIVEDSVMFPLMYKVQPISGKAPDKLYDSKQVWLTPKENTIETSYKHYLSTLQSEYAVSRYAPTEMAKEASTWQSSDPEGMMKRLTEIEAKDAPVFKTPEYGTVVITPRPPASEYGKKSIGG